MPDDPQTAAAAVTPQSGPAQPATTPTTDDGFERVPRDQYQTLIRNNERVRGMEQFYQAAQKGGFKNPTDFETWGKFRAFTEKQKLSPEILMRAFEDDAPAENKGGGLDLDTIKKELAGDYVSKSDLAHAQAMGKHELLEERAGGLTQKALAGLVEGANPRDKWLIEHAFRAVLGSPEHMRLYPEGHPLHDKAAMPHDEASITKIVEAVKKQIALSDGEEIANIGAEAAKGGKKTPTPAGSSTTSKTDKGDGTRRRPDGKPHPDDVQAAFDALQAKRKGGTMSSAGG